MKKSALTLLLTMAFAFACTAASALDLYDVGKDDQLYKNGKISVGLPDDTQEKVEQLVLTRSVPNVKNVKLTPANPAGGEDIKVEAEMFTYPRIARDETDEASVIFSIDGGITWQDVPMVKNPENEALWTATIPGQPSGTEVLYGFRIINYSGNMYIDALCRTAGNPLDDAAYAEKDCTGSEENKACSYMLPRNCMFPMAINVPDPDDESQVVPDDMDIQDARLGYDEKNLYLDIAVKGKISTGKISPMDIHIYAAGGLNPDRSAATKGIEQLIDQGAVMIYIPVDTDTPCSIYYTIGTKLRRDDFNSTCTSKENHLLFTIRREITEPNPSKTLEFMLFDFVQTSVFPLQMPLLDFSHFTRFKFEKRSFTVK